MPCLPDQVAGLSEVDLLELDLGADIDARLQRCQVRKLECTRWRGEGGDRRWWSSTSAQRAESQEGPTSDGLGLRGLHLTI